MTESPVSAGMPAEMRSRSSNSLGSFRNKERPSPVESADPPAGSSISAAGSNPNMSRKKSNSSPQVPMQRTQSRINVQSPAEVSGAGVFRHNLPRAIDPITVFRKAIVGEEDRVCHDIVKCCSLLETKWDAVAVAKYNGAAQSILQLPLDVLRRPETWHTWWSGVMANSKDFEGLAVRLYAENITNKVAGYDTDPLLPVGKSRLHERTTTMFHVWENPEAARNYVQGWNRVWQVILEHRIEGIFAPFSVMFCIEGMYISATALPPLLVKTQAPLVLPGPSAPTSLLGYMAEQLMSGLHVPADVEGLVLGHGIDGRYYVVSLKEVLTHKLPPPFQTYIVRTEALTRCMRDGALSQSSRYVMRTLVPKVVEEASKAVLKRRQDDRAISDLVRDGLLKNIMHSHGVNLALLHHVALCAHHRLLETQDSAFKVVIDVAFTEMVGRTLKMLIRNDIVYQSREGRDTPPDRLDVVNRIANLITSKDVPFWNDLLVPAMRVKYNAPDTFDLTHLQVHLSTTLRIASGRIGVEYNAEAGRFDRFVATSGSWVVACKAPDYLASEMPRTPDQIKDCVMTLWKDVEFAEGVAKKSFKGKAFIATVILQTATMLAKEDFDRTANNAAAAGALLDVRMEDVRLSSLMLDYKTEPEEKRAWVEKYVMKVTRFPSGNFQIDASQSTVRLLQAANTLKSIGDIPPLDLIEGAMRQFITSKNVDFTFSAYHSQSLVSAEQAVPNLADPLIVVYHRVVECIRENLRTLHGVVPEAKYGLRAMWAMVDARAAEGHVGSASLAAQCYEVQIAAFGYEDYRSAQMLFLSALFACQQIHRRSDEANALHDQIRRVLENMRAVGGANQIAIARAGVTLTIVYRMEIVLRKSNVSAVAITVGALLDYLKRFGMALFSTMYLQRVGRSFDDRKWINWLRRETATKTLQRIGRGMLHRKLGMFYLYRRKVMRHRTALVRLAQRAGRGCLLRLDMFCHLKLRCVARGYLTRMRLCLRRTSLLLIQRIGKGYIHRLYIAAPFMEEITRRNEMDRQRKVQEERERLSAAAERCRLRMAEVQRKLVESAWDRMRVCISDEQRRREKLLIDYTNDSAQLRKLMERDRLRREENAARSKDYELAERNARAAEDRQLLLERLKPDLVALQRRQYARLTPCPRPYAKNRGGINPSDPMGALIIQHGQTRLDLEQEYRLYSKELQHYAQHCRLHLARCIQLRKLSRTGLDAPTLAPGVVYHESDAERKMKLMHQSAIRIQCAWRSNLARFSTRWLRLSKEVRLRQLYPMYYADAGPLRTTDPKVRD